MGTRFTGFNMLKSFFDPCQVSYLIFYVTNRCNFNCRFCFYRDEIDKGRKPGELKTGEIEKIAKSIGPLIQLSLTGGEPFLRDDLAAITKIFIDKTGAKYITVPTNASLPQRIEEYIKNVLPASPSTYFRIVFSIDGINEAHDRYRSSPGAFDKVTASYEAASRLRRKYRNLVLDANAIFCSDTQDSILETLRTLHDKFSFDNLSVTYARGNIREPGLKKVSFQKYMDVNDFLMNLDRTKEKRRLYFLWRAVRDISRDHLIKTALEDRFVSPCVAGRKLVVISEEGEVYPCEILGRSMGNLHAHDYDIKRLLETEENKKLLKWIRESKCKCTFECALAANVLWGKPHYWRLVKAAIDNIGKRA